MKALIAALVLAVACGGAAPPEINAARSLEVTSDAFSDGGPIPARYGCDGDNVSPPLSWQPLSDSRGYVVTMTDRDAEGFVHWVLFDVPPSVSALIENTKPPEAELGVNDFGDTAYGGPCPPEGDRAHRYEVKVYALDQTPTAELSSGASLADVLTAIRCCVGALGTVTGTLER